MGVSDDERSDSKIDPILDSDLAIPTVGAWAPLNLASFVYYFLLTQTLLISAILIIIHNHSSPLKIYSVPCF